jgi:triosephosphate isomerase
VGEIRRCRIESKGMVYDKQGMYCLYDDAAKEIDSLTQQVEATVLKGALDQYGQPYDGYVVAYVPAHLIGKKVTCIIYESES